MKKLLGVLILALALAVTAFGQGVIGPAGDANYNTFSGIFAQPSVSWAATGMTLTYTGGTMVPLADTSTQAITAGTLTLAAATEYVYWSSGTGLAHSSVQATAQAGSWLYTCTTSGGNITGCYAVSQILPTTLYAVGSTTGSGVNVLATSPTLVTPALGVATATSINGITFTTAAGEVLTGTAGQTYTFPTTSATMARTDAANTFTGIQTMTSPVIATPIQTKGTTAVGATLSPTCAAQSGQVIFMGAATGEVVTLPAAGAGTVGCYFDFIITVTDTSNYNEIQTVGSNYLLGEVQACASGVSCLDFWADGSSIKALKMGQTTTGGFLGSHFRVIGISSTQWEIFGVELGSGTMVTAFTATP
jgi:hypothetical protein